MASYFRNFFGVQPALSGVGTQNSKSHKRSPSAPTTPTDPSLSYIYAAPGTTPSSSSSKTRERSNSYVARTNTPSPLRYAAYDSGSRSKGQQSRPSLPPLQPPSLQPSSQPSPHKSTRVHVYRTTGNKPGDRRKCSISTSINVFLKAYTLQSKAAPYPIYAHSSSYSSVHSTSSSSLHPGSSASGHRPRPPRTASSGSVAPSEPRPALKQNHTWNGSSKSGPRSSILLSVEPHANI